MSTHIRPLYWLGKTLAKIICMCLGRFRLHGTDNIPDEGGVLIAANHGSFLDPPVVGTGVKRPCFFMGKKELFDVPVFSWIIRHVGCFPVDREAPNKATLKFAVKILKEIGSPLVVFPEGGRTRDGELQEAGIGAALMASRAGAPIVPAYIKGTWESHGPGSKLPRRSNISVRYGEPIETATPDGKKASKEQLQVLTDRVMASLAALKAEAEADEAK